MGFFLQLGIVIAIIIVAKGFVSYMWGDPKHPRKKAKRLSKAEQAKSERERAEARKVYEALVKEKLDVMKTAITMGYSERELAKLDLRLEKLIGKDKLDKIAAGETPLADKDLLDTDLESELRRMRQESK